MVESQLPLNPCMISLNSALFHSLDQMLNCVQQMILKLLQARSYAELKLLQSLALYVMLAR